VGNWPHDTSAQRCQQHPFFRVRIKTRKETFGVTAPLIATVMGCCALALFRPRCVQPSESNHSRKLPSSCAVVPKVRNCFWTFSLFKNNQQASHYRGLMHIQSTTTFYHGLHSTSFSGADCCAAGLQTLLYVLPVSGCDKWWYLYRRGSVYRRDRCPHSVSRHPSNRHPRKLVPQTNPSTRTRPLNPIFMLGGAPKAHEVLPEK
jgi:hypothetical protein